MFWFVYILRCANGSYYVGHSVDPQRRLMRHAAGAGAQHTALYPPERTVYQESFPTEQDAVHRERQLKRWTRAKKEALIAGDMERLRILSRSRD
jgi:predicted GIY-YIG superfamily endonuclease